jgi:hypothetical protein
VTTDEVIAVLRERGFTLRLEDDGTPIIRGPTNEATPRLMKVLAIHRERIIARLRQAKGST